MKTNMWEKASIVCTIIVIVELAMMNWFGLDMAIVNAMRILLALTVIANFVCLRKGQKIKYDSKETESV